MPSSIPDWSALASQNERLVSGPAPAGTSAPAGAGPSPAPPPPSGGGAGRPSRRPRWAGRTARGAAASPAAIMAATTS
jgi:hypothetical protein